MKLTETPGSFSILRYSPDSRLPDWLMEQRGFLSITRTSEELSVVCLTSSVPDHPENREDGWSCLKVEGPLDFSLTGVLSSIASPLAEAQISIFAISTFDTDYILVKEEEIKRAKTVLRTSGFDISEAFSTPSC